MSGQLSLREARTKRQKNNSYISSRRSFRASMKATRNEHEAQEDENSTQRKKIKKDNTDTDEEQSMEVKEEGSGSNIEKGNEDEKAEDKKENTQDFGEESGGSKSATCKEGDGHVVDKNISNVENKNECEIKEILPEGSNVEAEPKKEEGETVIKKIKNPEGEGSRKPKKDEDSGESSSDSEMFPDAALAISATKEAEKEYREFLKLEREGAFGPVSNSDFDDSDDESEGESQPTTKKAAPIGNKRGDKKAEEKDNDDMEEGEDDDDDDNDDDDDDDMDNDGHEDDKNNGGPTGDGGGNGAKKDGDGNDNDSEGDNDEEEEKDGGIGEDENADSGGNSPKEKQEDLHEDMDGSTEGDLSAFEGYRDPGLGVDNILEMETEDETSDDDKSEVDSVAQKAIGDLNIADEYDKFQEDDGLGTSGTESKPDSCSDEEEKPMALDIAGALNPYEMDYDEDDEPSIEEDIYEFLSQDGGSGVGDESDYYEDIDYVGEVEEVRGTG